MFVTVAFYKAPGEFYDKLTRWWMLGPYSHCELVLEQVDSTATCASASPRDGGVCIREITFKPDAWDFVTVELSLDELLFAKDWLNKHKGKKYDFFGLFGFILRRIKDKQDSFFCSEAIAAMLQIEAPWRLDPNALYYVLKYKSKA